MVRGLGEWMRRYNHWRLIRAFEIGDRGMRCP
jgi:hypothetical protein